MWVWEEEDLTYLEHQEGLVAVLGGVDGELVLVRRVEGDLVRLGVRGPFLFDVAEELDGFDEPLLRRVRRGGQTQQVKVRGLRGLDETLSPGALRLGVVDQLAVVAEHGDAL